MVSFRERVEALYKGKKMCVKVPRISEKELAWSGAVVRAKLS